MKHKIALIATAIIVIAGVWIYIDGEKKEAELLRDMANLDRSYIPALMLSGKGQHEEFIIAMNRFVDGWEDFKKNNLDMQRLDAQWDEDMHKVQHQIQLALDLMESDAELKQIHEALEPIRKTMLELRQRNGMDYYLDYLSRYHDAMEKVVEKTQALDSAASVTELEQLKGDVEHARSLWQEVVNARLDKNIFIVDPQSLMQLQSLVNKTQQGLTELQAAIDAADAAKVKQLGAKLKPLFTQIYALFGNFDRDT